MQARIAAGVAALGLGPIPAPASARLLTYIDVLLAGQVQANLTGYKSADLIADRMVVDSLSVLVATGSLRGKRVIDVGSGAGAPGLLLGAVHQGDSAARITLLDSRKKRCEFLSQTVKDMELDLGSVAVMRGRAEDVAHEQSHRESYDVVLARGLANAPTALELTLPLCRVGGLTLLMKGDQCDSEVDSCLEAARILGGSLATVERVPIPSSATGWHTLVAFRKTRRTPERFPRRQGEPRSNPLLPKPLRA